MRKTNFAVSMLLILSTSPVAFAATATKKEATQIEFNQLIDQNDQTKRMLTKVDPRPASAPMERGQIADFIDVEIGVGQAPTLTDRR